MVQPLTLYTITVLHNAQRYRRTDGRTDSLHYDARSRSYCIDRAKNEDPRSCIFILISYSLLHLW